MRNSPVKGEPSEGPVTTNATENKDDHGKDPAIALLPPEIKVPKTPAKDSLDNFPPLVPMLPVTKETLQGILAEYERELQPKPETEKVLQEFSLTKSTLLFLVCLSGNFCPL